jgi:hypothetical protein
MEKKKSSPKAGTAKPAEAIVKRAAPPAAAANPQPLVAPPSMDFPVAIQEDGHDFEVESTNKHPIPFSFESPSDDVVEAIDDDGDSDEIQPFKLA